MQNETKKESGLTFEQECHSLEYSLEHPCISLCHRWDELVRMVEGGVRHFLGRFREFHRSCASGVRAPGKKGS